jgi:Uncharacterized protein conserved in bacteria
MSTVFGFSREHLDKPYLIGYNSCVVMILTREFVILPEFDKQWKSMNLTDNELLRLEENILENPKIGDVIRGTGKLRKMRFAFNNKGKSGSARVIYVDFAAYEKVYLIVAYPKSEKDNLSKEECNKMKLVIDTLEKTLKEISYGRI